MIIIIVAVNNLMDTSYSGDIPYKDAQNVAPRGRSDAIDVIRKL